MAKNTVKERADAFSSASGQVDIGSAIKKLAGKSFNAVRQGLEAIIGPIVDVEEPKVKEIIENTSNGVSLDDNIENLKIMMSDREAGSNFIKEGEPKSMGGGKPVGTVLSEEGETALEVKGHMYDKTDMVPGERIGKPEYKDPPVAQTVKRILNNDLDSRGYFKEVSGNPRQVWMSNKAEELGIRYLHRRPADVLKEIEKKAGK